MSAADRIALLLGRAIMRAEALQAELALLRARLAEFENDLGKEREVTRDP